LHFITSFTSIRNYRLVSNGELIFDGKPLMLAQFLEAAYEKIKFDYPKFYKMDRLSQLGILATEMLLNHRKLNAEIDAEKIAVVLSNKHASLDTDLRYFQTTKTMASPALFVYTLPNIVIGEICIRHGIKGENSFFIFDQFNPHFLSAHVNALLKDGIADACIAGWVEVIGEEHDVFLFLVEKETNNQSGILSPENLTKLYRGDYGTTNG
jgi:hypothetical protein